jgi:DNA-directed RNA polymerase specialized sigma24 family protein
MATKENARHYVDNERFLSEMTEFRNAVILSKENNTERPRVPNYIGECLFKIATHLARKPNFANYTFREDMVSDGIENCLLYIDNFDPEKSKNPFAYFTQIIYYAFLRRIQKEKKHLYIKYKSMDNLIITSLIENNGEEYVTAGLNGVLHDAYSEEFISDFIKAFEVNKEKKIASAKPRKKKTETVFDEIRAIIDKSLGTTMKKQGQRKYENMSTR